MGLQELKKITLHHLESNELESIVSLAKIDRKVLSSLVRIAYDKETLIGWRAIKAIGMAARALIATDYPFLRETIRKLLWSLSDESGGIGWAAPEIIGEIVSADPEKFSDVIPLIAEVYGIEEKIFRLGIMYAFGRIASVNPAFVLPHKELVLTALTDENPLTRVYGLEVTGMLKELLGKEDRLTAKKLIEKLLKDQAEVWIYKGAEFINIQVREAVMLVNL